MATDAGSRVEDLAQDLFGLFTQVSLNTQPQQRRGMELKEVEFLTLSLLHVQGTMIVGKIQRMLGVLPAQMSRIIRSLENRDPSLIECQINTQDKRKIDVRITPAGTQALLEYQEVRVNKLMELLRRVPDEEQEDLERLIHKLGWMLDR